MTRSLDIIVAGAGLAGSLLASLLAQDGHRVRVYERRPDPRRSGFIGGRSINLALSARGLAALEAIGIRDEILETVVPMRGRIMHSPTGETSFHAYSADPANAINSVSRGDLNLRLIDKAASMPGVTLHFEEPVVDVDLANGIAMIQHAHDDEPRLEKADLIVGADGAYSSIRGAMQRYGGFGFSQEFISHGYKELVIPPDQHGNFAIEHDALHIWPRGASMMIALPNEDRSFTCTLFWPREGEGTSFESLNAASDPRVFIKNLYPDAVDHMPDLETDCRENPVGHLVTIRCDQWHCGPSTVLLGDAAHAIVPFFGQGMNAAMQDCMVLREQLRSHDGDVATAIRAFSRQQKPNGDAIAQLSFENFVIMRDKVSSPMYRLRQRLENWLHRLLPQHVGSVYNLVSFSTTPYADIVGRRARRRRATRGILTVMLGLIFMAIAFSVGILI